uniref:Uncharacterized protein n=1 Tax=Arundo donax TaxID=35708 RepID=A0A0A9EEP3_ARUDO
MPGNGERTQSQMLRPSSLVLVD